jgi:SAM-dependent methyltransferase
MHYDPIKEVLGKFFNISPGLRILFYKLLDLLLLRTWHIKRELNKWAKSEERRAKSDIKILDAGSGYGQYSYYLSNLNKNWQILGVDVMEKQIQDCNEFFLKLKKQNISFRKEDLTRFAEKDSFDFILSVDVMEHILEDELVFRNFYVSLKKGGMLLISTPSDKGGSEAHDEHDESFIGEHVRNGYNIDDIQAKLKRAGFSNAEARYSYGKPGHIAWLLSMKYPISILGFSKLFFILLPFYYILIFPFCLILNWFDVRLEHETGTGLIVKAVK